jgi:hypothetical protein
MSKAEVGEVVENPTYSTDMVLIPTFKVLIGCTNCDSRNIRTFPNVQFMDDDFPQRASNFVHIQGQCNDCGKFIMVSPRLYMIDSHGRNEEGMETGKLHFAGTLVDAGGTEDSPPPKKTKARKPKVKLVEGKTKKRKRKRTAGPDKFDKAISKAKKGIVEDEEWFSCRYCGKEYVYDKARLKHQKTCDKKPDEPEERKALFLPSSTEVTQDPADADKSILYTSSSDTLVNLVHEAQTSAYRKDFTTCPRTEYVDDGKGGTKSVVCNYRADEDDWLSPPMLKEISFGISDFDIMAPLASSQEEMVICISECPKCGRRSILHKFITTMLWYDFTDHRKIMDEIIDRGLMEGKVKKKELTKEQVDTRLDLEAQRLGVGDMMKEVRKDAQKAQEKVVPEFELECHHPDCQAIWTKENSNPRWFTASHLVARCPDCGSQRPIQDEV